jgi:long-chain acyl-CoA synthetase
MAVKTIYDILVQYKQDCPAKEDALAQKVGDHWLKYSISEYVEIVDNLAIGLYALGIEKGDKVASITDNRPQWNFIDMATAKIGAIHVSVYSNIKNEDISYILNHAAAKIIFVGNDIYFQKITRIFLTLSTIPLVFTFDEIKDVHNFDEIVSLGVKRKQKYESKIKEIYSGLQEDEMRSIIYTSGTTGLPKGVMLSHKNLLSNVIATKDILPLNEKDRIISFLPISHVLERMLNYLFQYKKVSIYYAESVDNLVANIREVKPAGFGTVPRLIEKIYSRIENMGEELKGIKKLIYREALKMAESYPERGYWSPKSLLKHRILDKLVYSKWREAIGNNIKIIIVGGAALQPRLAAAFRAAGIKLTEGYGLTETSPVIAVNHENYPNFKFGTVGPIVPGVEVKLAPDNEILVKGPNVMLGYYLDESATEKSFDQEGWFKTGDIGDIDKKGFLRITDRKKEIFKLSTGIYVTPQLIENTLKKSEYIDQVMIIGENEKFVSAFIVPDFDILYKKAKELKLSFADNRRLIKQSEVLNIYDEEISKLNSELGNVQQIKRFVLIPDIWSIESGELSPTLKLKRDVLRKKYETSINSIYKSNN